MKIAIASDHGGLELKNSLFNYLKEKHVIEDFGTNTKDSCDYPFFAKKVAKEVANKNFDKGILICTTGQGMAICANKTKGIRAVCVSDKYCAQMTREHNNANILTMGQKIVDETLAKEIVDIWLNAEFQGERHQRRVDMLEE